MSKLSTLTKEIYDRTILTKRVAALTGGTRAAEAIVVTNGGTGYTSAPTVAFTGGGGSGAAATAVVADGVVVSVTITNHGSGYTSTPTISFTGVGSGATGTAIMAATTLDAIPTLDKEAGFLLFVTVTNVVYGYRLVSETFAEASPVVIRPDDYTVDTPKVWQLQGLKANSLNVEQLNTNAIAFGSNATVYVNNGLQVGVFNDDRLGFWGATPVIQPAGAGQAAVTLGNADGAIGGLTFSATPTQAEVEALRNSCETLADDVRNLSTLVHALRTAGIAAGIWKGAA